MSLFRSLLFLAVVLAYASPAAAQIYSWRDADGKLVLSDKPRSGRRRADHLCSARRPVTATTRSHRATKSAPYDAAITEHARRQRRGRRSGARGDPGRIRVQSRRRLEQGRDGPDAADAGDGHRARRQQPLRSRPEHPRRRDLPEAAAQSLRPEGRTGAGRLQRRHRQRRQSTATVPPFKETRNYVDKITKAAPAASPGEHRSTGGWSWSTASPSRSSRTSRPPSGSYQIVRYVRPPVQPVPVSPASPFPSPCRRDRLTCSASF